jgi:type I restriction-modification system DNA methylase subunit
MGAESSTAATDIYNIAGRLWETADQLRANSDLKAGEYSTPVMGLIFSKYADNRFTQVEAKLVGSGTGQRGSGKADYQAQKVNHDGFRVDRYSSKSSNLHALA